MENSYGADLLAAGEVSERAIADVADRTEGVTASFAKELIRRTVLQAAAAGRTPSDADLLAATEELLSDTEALTRTLLGAGAPFSPAPDLDEHSTPEDSAAAQPGVAPAGSATRSPTPSPTLSDSYPA